MIAASGLCSTPISSVSRISRPNEGMARAAPEIATAVSRPLPVWPMNHPSGIAIAPGAIFSARRRFGHCLRISTGYPWSPRIERAIATVGDLIARGST